METTDLDRAYGRLRNFINDGDTMMGQNGSEELIDIIGLLTRALAEQVAYEIDMGWY